MNTKFLPVVLAVGAMLLVPNMVQAQMPTSPGQDPIALYVEAGASVDQQSKIRTLAHEFETTARVKVERAANLMRKMQAYSLEPMPDERAVLATQAEINSLQSELANARIKLMLQIRSVLSDEQRGRLVQLLKEQHRLQQPGM
jgi:Spy/CpxP family protein refolding chaperone